MTASLPTSDAERRVVLLYLVSLAVRPVEGHDDPDEWEADDSTSRPGLVLRLTLVATEWAASSNSLDVRRALRRTGSTRTLGARGFLNTVRDLSTGLRDHNEAARRARFDRGTNIPGLTQPEMRLAADECSVSRRQHASTELVRLRRDFGLDGSLAWETGLDFFTDDDPGFEDLLEQATDLGFDTTSPIPSAWVQRVEPEDWDDDDDDDAPAAPTFVAPVVEPDEAPTNRVREPRPAFVPSPSVPFTQHEKFDRPRHVPKQPAPETVQEMYARWKREEAEKAAKTARLAKTDWRVGYRTPTRQWDCASCGHYDRHAIPSLTPPTVCPACRGTVFV
jgi:predicted Zn-ribbon and HTH transcriptional regulator